MDLSDFLKKIDEEETGEDHQSSSEEIEMEENPIRERIRNLLAGGSRPASEILILILADCTEEEVREALWGWEELIAETEWGMTMWEIRPIPDTADLIDVDPVALAERVSMKCEHEISAGESGKPVVTYRGHVLAWERDTTVTKVYAWCLVNLHPAKFLPVDMGAVARSLELSPGDVRGELAHLVRDGDLIREWKRGREFFKLNIRYC